jgi:O-antigen/teichoic acid export membrane protein
MMAKSIRLIRSKQFLNLALQGFSLLSKFALMLAITRLLSLETLGRYHVITATIALLSPLASLQFGKYVQRQLPYADAHETVRYIKRFLLITLALSALIVPVAGIYLSQLVSGSSLLIVLLIFFGAVITVELNFQLMGMHRGTSYNMLNFLSQSAWAIPLIIYWLFIGTPGLDTLWYCWFLGQLSAVIGFFILCRKLPWKTTPMGWDAAWFKKGVGVSLGQCLILLLSLATVHAMTFLLRHTADLTMVGIYGFFFTVLIAMRQWVLSGSFVLRQPKLIVAWRAQDHQAFKTEFYKLMRESALTYGIACALALGAIYPVLWLTDNALLRAEISLFYGFLAAGAGYILSDILQAIAFIQHRHALMIKANALFLVMQISLAIPVIYYLPTAFLALPLALSALVRCIIYATSMRQSWR